MKGIVFVLSGLAALSPALHAGELFEAERPIPGRYVVVFRTEAVRPAQAPPTAPGRTVSQLMSEVALQHGGVAERVFEHALQGGVVVLPEGRARALARDPRVAWVEEDGEIEAFATQGGGTAHWGLDRVDERDRPLNNHYTYNQTGAGVNIYVIDTGVKVDNFQYPGRLVNAYSTVRDAGGNMVFGDPVGHGSNVAIIAAGGLSGVAKGATLRAVRVTTTTCGSSGGGGGDPPAFQGTCFSLTKLLEAINWVAGNRVKPAVANLSLGGGVSPSLDAATSGMVSAGVTVVAAAGNSNLNACNVSPAHIPELLTVAASDQNDQRAVFSSTASSNFGSCVDLFAPGKELAGGGLSGTSFAAPMVAGAAAMYLQTNTTASPATVHAYVVNNATTGRLGSIGSGSPNRLLFVPPGGSEVDNPPTANFTYSCSGTSCTFTNTSTDDFGIFDCSWDWGHAFDFQPYYGCSISHWFPGPGTYTVKLTARDDGFQSSTKTKLVTVN